MRGIGTDEDQLSVDHQIGGWVTRGREQGSKDVRTSLRACALLRQALAGRMDSLLDL
jgi:hypothetical protein